MSTLSELVRSRTDLRPADIDWLHLLVAEWQLLADLSFADLLLWVRLRGEDAYLSVAQMRPTTGPTAYQDDKVGLVAAASQRYLLDRAAREGRICREGEPEWQSGVPVREEAIPVRHQGRVIAVVARDTNLAAARAPSRLELAYLQTAGELAEMICAGTFPFPGVTPDLETGPRVGDGLLRLDPQGLVTFASPNALSAYRRLGVAGDLLGANLGELTARLAASGHLPGVGAVLGGRQPVESEVEAHGAVVLLRAVPLLDGPGGLDGPPVLGAVVLVRDVTELRRRDRQLLTKDATIREIHHRVKNNLQTVAALLRLQARRLTGPEARAALEESVRRVSSIALVHETLSLTLDEWVHFDDIADRIASMVGEVAAPESAVNTERRGSFGMLPAQIATPLAMVLTELLHNAVEHAFPPGLSGRRLEVRVECRPTTLLVVVADNGTGLPPGFDLNASSHLGLKIVRTLMGSELAGTIELRNRPGGGTEAAFTVRLPG